MGEGTATVQNAGMLNHEGKPLDTNAKDTTIAFLSREVDRGHGLYIASWRY